MIPADAELTARHDEIPAWDDMPDELKPVLAPPDGGLRRLPRAHRPPRRPAGRRARGPRGPRRHARLLHHRRQRRLAPRARCNGTFNEMISFNGAAALETPEFMVERIDDFGGAGRRTTTTRSAGRTRWTRRTSGPSRSPRTGAARATARSCTGPTGIEAQGEIRTQFHHVIDVAPTVLEAAGLPEPTFVNGVQQTPMRGREHALRVRRRRRRPSATRRSTSRCSATAASTTRAGPRSPGTATPWEFSAAAAAVRRRRLGALRHQHRLDPGARPRRRASRQARTSCSGCS